MIERMRFPTFALLAFAMICMRVPPAHAQTPGAVTEGAPGTNAASDFVVAGTDLANVPDITDEGGQERISIDLRDVALRDVVTLFSRMDGVNLIASTSNLNLMVSAKLDNVEWKPALTSILSIHNMALKESPPGAGVYQIVDRGPDEPEPLVVETVFLEYATVDEVAPVISKMLPAGSQLSTFRSRNAMVLRSTAQTIAEVKTIIKYLDIQQRQVCVEAQFFELNDEASKQLGIRWDGLEELNIGGQLGPFSWQDNTTHDRTTSDISTRTDGRTQSDQVTKYYDQDGRQFEGTGPAVQGRTTYVNDGVNSVDGPSYDRAGNVSIIDGASGDQLMPTRTTSDSIDLTQVAISSVGDQFAQAITQDKAAILNGIGFDMVISALKKTDGVTIVSNPKIIVSSGQTNAFFSVGDREPIIRKTIKRGTTDSPGDEVLANLDTSINTDSIRGGYLSTGIELKVIPTVKTDELIEASIVPSLRRKLGDKTVEGNSWPIISVKEIMTRFTLRSGETVAIGGLTDTSTENVVTKVPVLGSIPLIGKYLFSHEKDVKTQNETIIFVTLSLADPTAISKDAGIPRRAELVHETVERMDKRAEMLEQRRKQIKDAADKPEAAPAEKKPRGLIPALIGE